MMPNHDDFDPETGEVHEDTAAVSPSAYPHDAEQPPAFESYAHFLAALEDGDLNAQLSAHLKRVAQEMTRIAANYGGRPKAKIVLSLDFELESGVYSIRPKVKVDTPLPPRGHSNMWALGDGRFTPVNPKQLDMFTRGKPRAV